MLQKIYK